MARTKAPLMSLDASGSIGESIVFSKWRGRNYVRRHSIPANPNSDLQRAVRAVFKYVTQDWANLSTTEQNSWDDLASVENITLLDAMVADAVDRARRTNQWRKSVGAVAGTTPDAPADISAFSQPQALRVTWTDGVAVPDYAWLVYAILASGNQTFDELKVVVATGTNEALIRNLVSGSSYTVGVVGMNADGEKGPALTTTGTPS